MNLPTPPKPPRPPTPVHRDALDFQSDATEIALRPLPPGARVLLYAIVAFLLFGIVWVCFGQVDRVITATGRLTTEAPEIVLQSFETATIRTIKVRAGDIVHKGDVLATLDPTFAEADTSALQDRLNALAATTARLNGELKGPVLEHFSANPDLDALNQRLDATRRSYVASELATFDAQTQEFTNQIASQAQEIADIRQQLTAQTRITAARQELYNRKVGSLLQLLEAQNTLVATQRELHRIQGALNDLKAQIETQKKKRASFLADWRKKATEELQTAQQEQDKLTQELRKSTRRTDLVQLTAPDDAVVLQLAQRSVGSVAKEGETLITLVPLNSPLQITAELDPQDVARVRNGDKVVVKLDALPFQRHGTIEGTLLTVSQDTVERNPANGADKPDPTKQPAPAYRAIIAIKAQNLRDVPQDFRLIPGMGVKAEIKIGQRSLISYFIYPLLQAGSESFREP